MCVLASSQGVTLSAQYCIVSFASLFSFIAAWALVVKKKKKKSSNKQPTKSKQKILCLCMCVPHNVLYVLSFRTTVFLNLTRMVPK